MKEQKFSVVYKAIDNLELRIKVSINNSQFPPKVCKLNPQFSIPAIGGQAQLNIMLSPEHVYKFMYPRCNRSYTRSVLLSTYQFCNP